jgi:hAT family C-terminal dimerisation region
MARDYFAIPATSVPSEQAFSIAGDLISKKRNRMAPETANELMCLKSWYGLGEIAEDELSEEINATTEMENEREDNLEIEMIENNLSS